LFQKGLLPAAMCSRFTRVSHSATYPYRETLPLYSDKKTTDYRFFASFRP